MKTGEDSRRLEGRFTEKKRGGREVASKWTERRQKGSGKSGFEILVVDMITV